MRNIIKSVILAWAMLGSVACFSQGIEIGHIDTIQSSILGEERYVSVYLPPSYGENPAVTYPVIYLIDGDYNFHYVSGLVEQLSAIGELIPEMIVVGISDMGHERYVKNCTPLDSVANPTGNAHNFSVFITNELKPAMDAKYQTSTFDFLVGHSLGGLFVVNTLLETPEKFQNYVAISPSLWWNDYKAKDQVLPFYELYDNIDRSLFITLGDEKGMGVMGFVDQLDVGDFSDTYLQKTPLGLKYHYQRYPEENHNSVGLVSLSDALKWRFEGYAFDSEQWAGIDDFEKYLAHIAPFQRMVGDGFRIPASQLKIFVNKAARDSANALNAMAEFLETEIPASMFDYYHFVGQQQLQAEAYSDAILTFRKAMELCPNNPQVYTDLAESFAGKGDAGMTKHYRQKALDTALENGSRRWYVNQLRANLNGM